MMNIRHVELGIAYPYHHCLHHAFQRTSLLLSVCLLYAWKGSTSVIHIAIDDVQSFTWVLICVCVSNYIPERYEGATDMNPAISLLKKAFESKALNYTITKETHVDYGWTDFVFGDLI